MNIEAQQVLTGVTLAEHKPDLEVFILKPDKVQSKEKQKERRRRGRGFPEIILDLSLNPIHSD